MIIVSERFKKTLDERTDFRCGGEIELTDGQKLTLTEEDLTLTGTSVTDGAGSDELPLGEAICRTVTVELMNDDGHLDGYDFFGARVKLWLLLTLDDGTEEKLRFGTFTVLEPESWGETVIISACDDMVKTDRSYHTELVFPATLGSMFRDICDQCDIPYSTSAFPNEDFVVNAPPAGEYTFRRVLGDIAMIAGGNARVDRDGRMRILYYDFAVEPAHVLRHWSSLKLGTDDILITGLETSVPAEDGLETSTVRVGEEGYVLAVENTLIAGKEAQALERMGRGLIGASFRKFEGEHTAWPMAEFMDMASVTDRKGNQYFTVITDVDFAVGGYTTFANSARSAVRNSSKYVPSDVKARIQARELAERERTARERAVEHLGQLLADSGGLFATAQTLPDGSGVYYLHDKPALADSGCVMKLTGSAIGLSMDGGKTYPYGFAVTGEMVMGIIQAEGLSADWVKFGTLDQERVNGLPELAAGLEVLRERITAAVSSVEALSGETQQKIDDLGGTLGEQIQQVQEQSSGLTAMAAGLSATVSDMQKAIDAASGEVESVQGQLSELRQTASRLELRFDQVEVDHVTTSSGYTFDANGLDIHKAGEDVHNTIDNKGMYVRRTVGDSEEIMLRADASGVEATDVQVNNFLSLGEYTRFEDYSDGTDSRRTACFYVG